MNQQIETSGKGYSIGDEYTFIPRPSFWRRLFGLPAKKPKRFVVTEVVDGTITKVEME